MTDSEASTASSQESPQRQDASYLASIESYQAKSHDTGPLGGECADFPDLVVNQVAGSCQPGGTVRLTAILENRGEAGVAAGVKIAFYLGDPNNGGTLLGVDTSLTPLAPGQAGLTSIEVPSQGNGLITLYVSADDDGTGAGSVAECEETNNLSSEPVSLDCGGADPSPTCVDVHLSDYTLFLTGDYSGGHDVTGKVAAGGNISMVHFSVGESLPANDIANTLVAGGDLSLSHGGVWGDAHYGGTFSTDPSVVFYRGSPSQGTPIDFTARGAELSTLSSDLAALAPSGTVDVQPWGGVFLTGADPTVNVFQVDASDLSTAVLLSIDAPVGSLALINVVGGPALTLQGGFTFSGGIDPYQVLFNAPTATTVTASGYSLFGTLLAPQADISFNNGSFEGAIFARSLTGDAAGHFHPLFDTTVCPVTP